MKVKYIFSGILYLASLTYSYSQEISVSYNKTSFQVLMAIS